MGPLGTNYAGERISTTVRPPILDDTDIPSGSDYLWADTRPDWPAIATDRAATIIRQTQELRQTSRALREALMQRDLWSVLAFAVGVVCGVGLAVLW